MLRRTLLSSLMLATFGIGTASGACARIAGSAASEVAGELAAVQIIDRSAGTRLPIYWHNGRRYVAGTPGNRYAIAVRNRSGGRVLTVLAVDGVNAVTGETAAWDQNGYVFSPGQRWEVRGWRKSQDRIAAFEFTALPDSYAARTGRPDNVGVIGVAIFREVSRVHPAPAQLPERLGDARSEPRRAAGESAGSAGAAADSGATPPSGAAAAPASAPPAARAQAESSVGAESSLRRQEAAKLGTGHGRSESSWVSYTDFERARPTPDEIVVIHYDSRENLIAMGVIPDAKPLPRPFPGNLGFVPDPPR